MKLLVSFFVIVLFGSTFAQNKIELIDIMKMFAKIDGVSYGWSTGAEENSPIEWLTVGLDETPERDPLSKFYWLHRIGQIIITIDDKPTLILKKKLEPAYWVITAYGPRAGIDAINFTDEILGGKAGDYKMIVNYLINNGAEVKQILCSSEISFTYGERLYEVNLKGKDKFWIKIDYSEGSAGVAGNILMLLYEPEKEFLDLYDLTNKICP